MKRVLTLIPILTLAFWAMFGAATAAWAQSTHDIFRKPWAPVSKTELTRFFRAVDIDDRIGVPQDWLSVGQQDLSWSPGAKLIRVYGAWQPKSLFIYYLRDKSGKYSPLNGTSPAIHALNKAYPPLLTTQTVKDYIWFFGFFVRGKEGPFLPLETSKDTFMPKGALGGTLARGFKTANDVPRPITCGKGAGKDLFSCDVVVMYSNAMFEAKMAVSAAGMIRMDSDKPVATDLKFKILAPISVASVQGSFVKPSGPPAAAKAAPAQVTGLPADAQRVYDGLVAGRALKLDDRTSPFLAGMAASMLKRCGMPRNGAAKVRLQAFTTSSSISAMMGTDYSNRNIGTAIGSAAKQQALLGAGAKVTDQIGCGPALDKLGMRIAEIIKANSAAGSRFVDSCSPVHGKRSCTCLANLARPVIPGIASRTYHRSDIAELIQRNPMTGLMVGLSCGITNY